MTDLQGLLESVRDQLRGLRALRGMSQTQLGALVGRNQSTVSHQLGGRYADLHLSTIVQYASALDADIEVLIRPRGLPRSPLTAWRDNQDLYRCPDGLWTATGPRGEVEAQLGTRDRVWELWMGQGGAWGDRVAQHVMSCPACSMLCRIETV